jgi:hypothetical protein
MSPKDEDLFGKAFPFVAAVTFADHAGAAHVVCGNGAHFAWTADGWRELPPIPGSAYAPTYEMDRRRKRPIEPVVFAVIDEMSEKKYLAQRWYVRDEVVRRTGRRVGNHYPDVESAINKMLERGQLVEQRHLVKTRKGRKDWMVEVNAMTRPETALDDTWVANPLEKVDYYF